MNRIDRLAAILLRLQGGKRTAAELAAHFEVSRRTILRDMQALGEMGIPLIAEVGVEGGYSLPDDYALRPLALTLHEAILLRLALSGLAQLGTAPFERARTSLLDKAQTLLPRHERATLDQFAQTLTLNQSPQPYPTPFLDRLLEDARLGRWVTAVYRSERGESRQTLLPRQVRSSSGLWYCEAYSLEREATRVYRVDRFGDVQTALSPPQRTTPLPELAPHFDDSYPEVRIALTARGVLLLEPESRLTPFLRRTTAGGELVVRLQPDDYDWLGRILLGLGTEARIVAPDGLRERVREAAEAIARHHAEW